MATGSVNIPARKSQTKGNCNEKCSLSFKYQASNCTVTNKGNYLSIGYEHNDSQVIYNNSNYKVEDVRLYSPSVNKFNGSRADAEMIVLHKNNRNEYLAVCVPIKKSNATNPSSILLNQIISAAPVRTNKTNDVSVNNYSLNHFIPKAPFYSHTGPLPWDLTVRNVNYVIFDMSKSSAKIDNNTFKLLLKLINEKNFTVSKMSSLFYNEKGSTNIGGKEEQDIFIDCQRVISSGPESKKKINEEVPTNPADNSINQLFRSNMFQQIIGIVAVIGGGMLVFSGFYRLSIWWRSRKARMATRRFRTRSTGSRSTGSRSTASSSTTSQSTN